MVGIDIVDVRRFHPIKKAAYRYWSKFFLPEEWKFCFSQPGPAKHLAGTFAAKEAVLKAWGKRLPGGLTDIEVSRGSDGAPSAWIRGQRGKGVMVSISHEKNYAVAVALITNSTNAVKRTKRKS